MAGFYERRNGRDKRAIFPDKKTRKIQSSELQNTNTQAHQCPSLCVTKRNRCRQNPDNSPNSFAPILFKQSFTKFVLHIGSLAF